MRNRGRRDIIWRVLFDEKPLEDREYPDEGDLQEQEESAVRLVRCPMCRQMVYEQAPQCPHCREWLIGERPGWRSSRWYVRVGLFLTKTLLWNWLFWLLLAAIAAAAAVWEILK